MTGYSHVPCAIYLFLSADSTLRGAFCVRFFHYIYTTFRGKKCSIKRKIKHKTNEKEKLKPLEITELFSNSKGFSDGGGEGNRTPVRKPIHETFSGRIRLFEFPFHAGKRHSAWSGSFISSCYAAKLRHIHVHCCVTPHPKPQYSSV